MRDVFSLIMEIIQDVLRLLSGYLFAQENLCDINHSCFVTLFPVIYIYVNTRSQLCILG
jgi:hypothetical protein